MYIYLTALSHQKNIIPHSQVIREILNLQNVTNLIGLQLFNPLLKKQNFLKHFLKNLKSTFAVSSAVWDHSSQVFKFCKSISGLFSIVFTQFLEKHFYVVKVPLILPFYANSSQIQRSYLLKVQKPCIFTANPNGLLSFIQSYKEN